MSGRLKVAVGIPVWNGERYLAGAIESILSQTLSDFSLIISDNGSTDTTPEICNHFAAQDRRIQYHRREDNHGAAWNYNRVFELADATYFRWAAHDDELAPTCLERCVEVLDADPGIVLCDTETMIIDESGRDLRRLEHDLDLTSDDVRARYRDFQRFFSHLRNFHCNSVFGVIRAAALRETRLIGSYWGSDFVLLGELALRGRSAKVPEVLFRRREHGDRAFHAHRGQLEIAKWFDPTAPGNPVTPRWRCFSEHIKAIRRSDLRLRDRLACMLEVSRMQPWRRLAIEFRRAVAGKLRLRRASGR